MEDKGTIYHIYLYNFNFEKKKREENFFSTIY